jgi:hypothetical protein
MKESDHCECPLIPLCREMIRILDIEEESDSGRSFHPTTINSCRTVDLLAMNAAISGIKDYLKNEAQDKQMHATA